MAGALLLVAGRAGAGGRLGLAVPTEGFLGAAAALAEAFFFTGAAAGFAGAFFFVVFAALAGGLAAPFATGGATVFGSEAAGASGGGSVELDASASAGLAEPFAAFGAGADFAAPGVLVTLGALGALADPPAGDAVGAAAEALGSAGGDFSPAAPSSGARAGTSLALSDRSAAGGATASSSAG
jgi:hypothetical protein